MSNSKRTAMRVLVWVLTVWEALTMAAAGSSKFTNAGVWRDHFSSFGYPLWSTGLVGAVELVGVVLLLIPRTAAYAAGGLVVIMIGALVTNLIHQSELGWFAPTLHIALLTVIGLVRLRLTGGVVQK